MVSSDLYYYSALILWILGVLYVGGLFPWLVARYHHMAYKFTALPPKPGNHVRSAELVEVWSASTRLPGDWNADKKEREKLTVEMMDVEDEYVLLEHKAKDLEQDASQERKNERNTQATEYSRPL